MFKKIFDFFRKRSVEKRQLAETENKRKLEEDIKAIKAEKQRKADERKSEIKKAEPLLFEIKEFCEDILEDKMLHKINWGEKYNESKRYRRMMKEEYPSVFVGDEISNGDLIEVTNGDGKTFLIDAVTSWNRERIRFSKYYTKILERRDLGDSTYALYSACRFEIATLRNMVNRVLAEIE